MGAGAYLISMNYLSDYVSPFLVMAFRALGKVPEVWTVIFCIPD